MENLGKLLITVLITCFIPIAIYGASVATEHVYSSLDTILTSTYAMPGINGDNKVGVSHNVFTKFIYEEDLVQSFECISPEANGVVIDARTENSIMVCSLRNNTANGYTVSFSSRNGRLINDAPAGKQLSGEARVAIPYSLDIRTNSGYLGNNMTMTKAFTSTDVQSTKDGTSKTIISPSIPALGGLPANTALEVTSNAYFVTPTDMSFRLYVTIEETNAEKLKLAGKYGDIIYVTFTDSTN